ncbi:MAG: pro-sigmaK processing inhibitor BofA family protein [Candidatus Fermentithermobacillus carboniphilus]|uniref:Pro-sigmaK processing inhibitor BofA family protein n=1 Tax=Candidatus Fermentithermobacillus carboniphilus TaxID=3085328 RepID=A0AAT9LDA8_9FIRM|nr:MAG: pro-sigmaK processing inhibitor BofA family protein [Candidatus Fermentithermobacillus carboniphilus]
MDINVVLGILVASLVGVYVLKSLFRYAAGLGKVLMRSAIAFFAIWVANLVGGFFGFHMGLNLVSALVIGVLGIPGIGLLLAVKYLL